MEPDKPIVSHISCPFHEDLIRKVSINNSKTDLSLLCIDCCLEGKQNKELHTLEKFLKQIAMSYSYIPKLQEFPDSTNQILNTENEIVANFSFHIEKQKEQLNNVIDKLRQSVYQKLENKKRQIIANLEAQLKAFEEILSFYKQKVFCYRENHQNDLAKDQESAVTFESLFKEVSDTKNGTDLKKLLLMHYSNMKSTEIFTHVKSDEAKKIVTDAIVAMDTELIKLQTLKPTISFGVKFAESFEETVKVWSEKVDTAINELKIEVKDPVKPIEFRLQDPKDFDFDSLILKNDFINKTMIVNWVLEAIKAKQVSLNLLHRGSRDGFAAKSFHDKCDNKGPTVVIIENTTGNKFGGYAAVSWTSGGGDIKTNESFSSFLFSVDKKQKLPYKPESNLRVLGHYLAYGPLFGYSSTLAIYDNCNTNNSSFYNPDCVSYHHLQEGGYISGARNFTVKEIEVYSIVTK